MPKLEKGFYLHFVQGSRTTMVRIPLSDNIFAAMLKAQEFAVQEFIKEFDTSPFWANTQFITTILSGEVICQLVEDV